MSRKGSARLTANRKALMAATILTVEAYLTAAQTAFADADYTETRKQVILGEMELNKLFVSDSIDGEATMFRQSFKDLLSHIEAFEGEGTRGTRRSIAESV